MRLTAGGASDVGMVRKANQDSWMVGDRLWAVADGMGGHQGGEVASQVTIEVLGERFDEYTSAAFVEAAEEANSEVHGQASSRPELRGMGTTLCAMALVDTDDGAQALHVINIGDSRCYRWRDGDMTQITRDHSLVEDLRSSGQITDAEAAVHPHRNIVTRALGIQPRVAVDSFLVTPGEGDRYILCSDGLFNEVPVDRMAATLRRLADPGEAASELVRQANEAGGRDNVTCVVIDVLDATGAADPPDGDDIVASATVGGAAASNERPPDVAGITTALPATQLDDDGDDDGDGRRRSRSRGVGGRSGSQKGRDADGDEGRDVRLRWASWRTAAFVVLLLAIVGVAVLAVGWYSRGSYFVGFQGNEVTIFKGRPQSVLWFDPTVEQRMHIDRRQVPESYRDALVSGKQQSTLSDARAYVTRMRSVICSDLRNGAAPPSAPAGAPTTTIPKSCADLAATTTTSSTTSTVATTPTTTRTATTTAPSTTGAPPAGR